MATSVSASDVAKVHRAVRRWVSGDGSLYDVAVALEVEHWRFYQWCVMADLATVDGQPAGSWVTAEYALSVLAFYYATLKRGGRGGSN